MTSETPEAGGAAQADDKEVIDELCTSLKSALELLDYYRDALSDYPAHPFAGLALDAIVLRGERALDDATHLGSW